MRQILDDSQSLNVKQSAGQYLAEILGVFEKCGFEYDVSLDYNSHNANVMKKERECIAIGAK